MRTEKEIRRFIQENKISVPKDDHFMEDLVRQINQLPVPAAFSSKENEALQENIRIVSIIRTVLRRHYRRKAIRMTVILIMMCVVYLLMVAALIPSLGVMESSILVEHPNLLHYLVSGLLSLYSLLFTINTLSDMRI